MKINPLEQAVLAYFFESEGFKTETNDLSQIGIFDRKMTGKGFISQFIPNQLKVSGGPGNFTGGRIGAKINEMIEVGFLFFIKDGYVDAVEGYTYGEPWPPEITSFEFYLIDSPNA